MRAAGEKARLGGRLSAFSPYRPMIHIILKKPS